MILVIAHAKKWAGIVCTVALNADSVNKQIWNTKYEIQLKLRWVSILMNIYLSEKALLLIYMSSFYKGIKNIRYCDCWSFFE